MSTELFWLVLTIAMTGLIWMPYILDRLMVRGLMGALANPSPKDKPQSPWAQRMMGAHINAVENLVVFAPLVLTARALGIATATTAFACALDFWARLPPSWSTRWEFQVCARYPSRPVSWRKRSWCSPFSN